MMKNRTDYYSKGKLESRKKGLYSRERTAIDAITPLMETGQKFLDVGCGDCSFLNEISAKTPEVNFFGVDNSEFQLKKAKVRNKSFALKRCDLETRWPFEKNFFDFVYGAEIIEHIYNPDFFLSEANRVLKAGGYLIISTPNLCAWFNRIIFPLGLQPFFYETSTRSRLVGSGIFKKLKNGETPAGHIRIFNLDALKDLLAENGFEILKVKGTIFDSGFPKWLLPVDKIFTLRPQFSAGFVILARKKK